MIEKDKPTTAGIRHKNIFMMCKDNITDSHM